MAGEKGDTCIGPMQGREEQTGRGLVLFPSPHSWGRGAVITQHCSLFKWEGLLGRLLYDRLGKPIINSRTRGCETVPGRLQGLTHFPILAPVNGVWNVEWGMGRSKPR